MGMHSIKCMIGFSTFRNTPAGIALEAESDRMAHAYRDGHSNMLIAHERLHDAVDAALAGDRIALAKQGERGIRRLERSTRAISSLASGLERSRKALGQLIAEGTDPLAQRERFFNALDPAALFASIDRATGGASDRSAWNAVVGALRSGGAVAGLRLLERTAWRLQTALREQVAQSRTALAEEPLEVARQLHHAGLTGAVLADLFSTFLRHAAYLALLCEEATTLWEAEADGEEARTA
jgi:hypothetical protein